LIRIRSVILLFLISSAFFVSADETSDLLRPPVFSKNQFIFSYGRLTPGNDFIDRSSTDSLVMPECGITNTITRDDKRDVDYESIACSLYLERSIYGVRTSLNGGFLRTGGGVFDSLIESFHQSFGFPNGSRGRTSEHRYNVNGVTSSGGTFDIPASDFSIVDPQISFSIPLNLGKEGGEGLYIDLSSSIPISSGKFSLDKPDLKTTLSYLSNYASGFAYQFGTSALAHLDQEEHSVSYDQFSVGAFGSIQILVLDKFSFFIQNVVSSNIENNFLGLASYYWYADFGVRYPLASGSVLEFILRENPSPSSGTADASMFLRLIF